MVIDSSAIVAILFREADWRRYAEAIQAAPSRLISAATRVELSCVVEGRKHQVGKSLVERFLRLTGAEIVAVTPQHAEIAVEAFRRYGKGRHRARLNIGDCFSYALAAATNQPLLFKGADFVHTDLRPALPA